MRLFGSAVVGLIVLWLIDMELNHGRYADVALTAAHRWIPVDSRPSSLTLSPGARLVAQLRLTEPALRTLPFVEGASWSYFELRRLPLFTTNQTMTAASAQEGSLSSKRSWNLKAELSFICLNASSAESAFGPTRAGMHARAHSP